MPLCPISTLKIVGSEFRLHVPMQPGTLSRSHWVPSCPPVSSACAAAFFELLQKTQRERRALTVSDQREGEPAAGEQRQGELVGELQHEKRDHLHGAGGGGQRGGHGGGAGAAEERVVCVCAAGQ